jgi:hypothetical protein
MPMIAKPLDPPMLRRLLKSAGAVVLCLSIASGGVAVSPASSIAQVQQTQTQQVQKPTAQDQLLTQFYKDPRPERLTGFFDQFDAEHAGRWDAYPSAAGFFAVVFRKFPDRIEQIIPARFNPMSATAIAAALRMSGNDAMAAKLKPKLDQAGRDEKLAGDFGNLPTRLEDLSIRSPTHLDILWGAAFASGDARYVRMIIEFFAQVANRSEQMTTDIARVVIAMSGCPKEIYGELRNRYGNNDGALVIFAAAALWATESNARQHPFVEQVVNTYINENPGTYATRAMSALRPKTKPH